MRLVPTVASLSRKLAGWLERAPRQSTVHLRGFSGDLDRDRDAVVQTFGHSADLIVRELRAGSRKHIRILLVHIEGLVDEKLLADAVIKRIIDRSRDWIHPAQAFEHLKHSTIALSTVYETDSLEEFAVRIASGCCGVLVHGISRALTGSVPGWKQRNIEEPTTEATIRGSKEGFVESITVNTSLLRRRVRDPRLRFEEFEVGEISKTRVGLMYIAGVADENVVAELRQRIGRIRVDSIQESGHLEEFIEDAPLSPFPTILRTERPDKVAGALFEGRVAILTDGTPFVLIVPVTFTMFLTTPEDYYERYFIATALRMVRYLAFMVSLTLPAVYVAATTFHQEMLPTPLLVSIAAQREGIPFPAIIEALIMEVLFEILREAGVRLPKIVGEAVSIVGALVIGEAAMRAGLVSPAMVLVVSVTGIASFATPVFSLAIGARLLRFGMVVLGGTLGFFGIISGLFALSIHLVSLRSLGVPFMEPIAPAILSDLKDTVARAPWWAMKSRPELIAEGNRVRQVGDQMPAPGAGVRPGPRLAPGPAPRPASGRRSKGLRHTDQGDRIPGPGGYEGP